MNRRIAARYTASLVARAYAGWWKPRGGNAPGTTYFAAAALAVLLMLGGCAGTNLDPTSKVYAAVAALTAAERAALIYTTLPRCPRPPPCSDPATVQRIKDADTMAYNAVKLAERNEAMLGAALTAISGLQAVTPAN